MPDIRLSAPKLRRIILGATICREFFSVCVPGILSGIVIWGVLAIMIPAAARAASQGQVGLTSTGSIQITVIKTERLLVKPLAQPMRVQIPTAAAKAGQLSLCVTDQGPGAVHIGMLAGNEIQTLAPVTVATAVNGCLGLVQSFALPYAGAPIITLVAGPI